MLRSKRNELAVVERDPDQDFMNSCVRYLKKVDDQTRLGAQQEILSVLYRHLYPTPTPVYLQPQPAQPRPSAPYQGAAFQNSYESFQTDDLNHSYSSPTYQNL